MTAYSLDHIWSVAGDLRARFEHGVRRDAKSLSLVDETVTIRCYALYRNAFKGTTVSYSAAFLGFDALTKGFGAIE